MEEIKNFAFGFMILTSFFAFPQLMLDRLLRKMNVHLSDLAMVSIAPLTIMATLLPILFWEKPVTLESFNLNAIIFVFLAVYAVLAYLTLPAIAIRRVERFEAPLLRKNKYTVLTSQQARKRMKSILPFLVNPLTLILFLRLLFARGNCLYEKPFYTGLGFDIPLPTEKKKRRRKGDDALTGSYNPASGELMANDTHDIDGNLYGTF